MSTRSCIARKTKSGFSGVYHHWDGHIHSLGATLYEAFNGHFQQDLKAMLKYLIDDHPAGWSTINGADFSRNPGYEGTFGYDVNDPDSRQPVCYCHGDRKEEGWKVTQKNASGSGCEYAYVFEQKKGMKPTMHILCSYCGDGMGKCKGQKMIGFFGMGDENAEWRVVASVDLTGDEPNWDKLQKQAYSGLRVVEGGAK